MLWGWGKCGERAGARTQDQRLKRAMLYQLSYPLVLHIQVSTGRWLEARFVIGRDRPHEESNICR
jgi:hypothetical protein